LVSNSAKEEGHQGKSGDFKGSGNSRMLNDFVKNLET
jgi:hypothetical protein